jgi:putative ABC transport system substrate-binding protein
MRRRDFIASVGAVIAAGSREVRAQQTGRIYRIGSLHQSALGAPHHLAFYDELRSLGFIEGQNLFVDKEGYGLKLDELASHASALVKSPIDVILCGGDVAIRAVQQASDTAPIVAVTDDMVRAGFVRTLAKPAGNVTGISILATELDGKRGEILVEAVPGIDPWLPWPTRRRRRQGKPEPCRSSPTLKASRFRSIGLESQTKSPPR